MKGLEAKVHAKNVMVTSRCYVLYLLCEMRTGSNPANQVYARSFLRILSSFELLCLPVIFLLRDAGNRLYLCNMLENTPASLP